MNRPIRKDSVPLCTPIAGESPITPQINCPTAVLSSKPLINVHTFDGKLLGKYNPKRKYFRKEKKESFSKLLKILKNPLAQRTVQIIIEDLSKVGGTTANYQKENNIDSSDILFELCEYSDNECLLSNLEEQLADTIKLGICNSGRVTRLFQLYKAFCTPLLKKVVGPSPLVTESGEKENKENKKNL